MPLPAVPSTPPAPSGVRRPSGLALGVTGGLLAGVLLGAGGTAVGARLVGTKDLADGAVTSAKIKDGQVRGSDLAPSVRGALGPRASAYVVPFKDVAGPGPDSRIARARQVTGVTTPSTGLHCVSLAAGSGIDLATAVVQVTPATKSVEGGTVAWVPDGSDCAAGQIEVRTTDAGGALDDRVSFVLVIP
ncbi:hypothetical protein K8Z61_01095 [Nocardioides sp. TRM66260-LWL]|uniref:hypothetical protein n=1 Tax=Nocardioides sp. TRM66260-LWL TaxID=2874478 RepID=UPI001CC7E3FD|nr:hypothetical protein [Nocardioides sp. TRM66260-LWL]MBZ5733079.1 hypothetical protein [Nocardioides sp. TRM66260-LWL]